MRKIKNRNKITISVFLGLIVISIYNIYTDYKNLFSVNIIDVVYIFLVYYIAVYIIDSQYRNDKKNNYIMECWTEILNDIKDFNSILIENKIIENRKTLSFLKVVRNRVNIAIMLSKEHLMNSTLLEDFEKEFQTYDEYIGENIHDKEITEKEHLEMNNFYAKLEKNIRNIIMGIFN